MNNEARNAFLEANMGLVFAMARRFLRARPCRKVQLSDLVQSGCMAFLENADDYDPSVSKVASFMRRPIWEAMGQTYRDIEPAVTLPRWPAKDARCLDEYRETLFRGHGMSLNPRIDHSSTPDVARTSDLPMDVVSSMLGLSRRKKSILRDLMKGMKLKDTSRRLGVSFQRVAQVRDKALEVVAERLSSYGGAA